MNISLQQALHAAVQGLSYRSETNRPFEVFVWPEDGPLTPETLRKLGGHPADAEVTERPLEDFFKILTTEENWHEAAEKETVRQYRALLELIRTHLMEPKVYRVGETEVTIYIVGRTPAGNWAGLKTWAVET
jgi:Nuclease A inhibitor-like protein